MCLVASLAAHDSDIASALKDYEAERLPRTSRVQLEARERGRTYHLPSPLAQARRDFMFRLRGLFNPHTSGISRQLGLRVRRPQVSPQCVRHRAASCRLTSEDLF